MLSPIVSSTYFHWQKWKCRRNSSREHLLCWIISHRFSHGFSHLMVVNRELAAGVPSAVPAVNWLQQDGCARLAVVRWPWWVSHSDMAMASWPWWVVLYPCPLMPLHLLKFAIMSPFCHLFFGMNIPSPLPYLSLFSAFFPVLHYPFCIVVTRTEHNIPHIKYISIDAAKNCNGSFDSCGRISRSYYQSFQLCVICRFYKHPFYSFVKIIYEDVAEYWPKTEPWGTLLHISL